MLKRILLAVAALAVVGAGWVVYGFVQWRSAQIARLESASQVAKTKKGDVEYALTGKGPRTILFLHGTPGGFDQGKRLEQSAHERGYRVLSVSRPGYLRTPLRTGSSPAAQADAFAALLDTLGIERVNILGVSGGGPAAAQLAARHPQRCESLTMLSAVTQPLEESPRPPGLIEIFMRGTDFGAWLAWRQLHRNPAGVLARRGKSYARIAQKPERIESYLALADSALVLVSRRNEGMANDRRQFADGKELPLANIRCPTLAVHGREDEQVPLEHAELLAKSVPGAELVVIDGAEHLVSLTHPEQSFGPVYAMLDKVGSAPTPTEGVSAVAPAAQPLDPQAAAP